jgi:hypothetical protein
MGPAHIDRTVLPEAATLEAERPNSSVTGPCSLEPASATYAASRAFRPAGRRRGLASVSTFTFTRSVVLQLPPTE